MERVVFEGLEPGDAAELYQFRAQQLARRSNRVVHDTPPAVDGFEQAIAWATRSPLTREFLSELVSHSGEVVWLQEYCRARGLREEQLRGALGSFWRNARRYGFDLHNNPVVAWEMDQAERVGYRLTPDQAGIARRVLE